MTPRAILAALIASCIISAIMVYLTAKEWEPSGGPFCQYPTPAHVDYPMCEYKLRQAYIVNNG